MNFEGMKNRSYELVTFGTERGIPQQEALVAYGMAEEAGQIW